MSVVKDKEILCQTALADFSIESVNDVPFYKRYFEFCNLFKSKIREVDFESCFAQPLENDARKTIEWYYKPGMENPMKLSDLKEADNDLYGQLAQQREKVVNAIRGAMEKANENEQRYLKAVLANFDADYIDSVTYGYDGHVLFGIWGMRMKKDRQIGSVVTEGVRDHRVFRVMFDIQGSGFMSPFTSVNRRYGHILQGDRDIPRVTPDEGFRFVEWLPEAPHGKVVKSDLVYTAVCAKEEPKGSCYVVRFLTDECGKLIGQTRCEKHANEHIHRIEIPEVLPNAGYRFVGWDKNPNEYLVNEDVDFVAQYEAVEKPFVVRFFPGDHGNLQGQARYEKHANDHVRSEEVPKVVPTDGYRFIGWDKAPNDYLVNEDVDFVAQYEAVENESWWARFWGLGYGFLNWLLTFLLFGLIGLLLWYLLAGYKNFNFCGCDCDDPIPSRIIPIAHSGDVQILLSWSNINDLDVSCVDPNNDTVSYRKKSVRSGGMLDVDMNANDATENNPIENIYWPTGGAPKGKYTVYVTYYYHRAIAAKETSYQVKVKHGNVTETYNGVMEREGQKVEICSFEID